jgi:hypothetical protein
MEVFMKRVGVVSLLIALIVAGALFAQGMMGGNYYGGSGMMGNWDYIPPGDAKPLSIEQAKDQAQKYLLSLGYDSLKVSEVMEFSNHFYVEIAEKEGKNKAFELLLNKYTGAVSPEPGPNMMWNQKYGRMTGSMMGGNFIAQSETDSMTISEAKAHDLAQKFLDAQNTGLKVEDGADRFYGYYTIHVLKDGKTYGMLGVNGYTGQVWYHSWHGAFIDMKEFDGSM